MFRGVAIRFLITELPEPLMEQSPRFHVSTNFDASTN